LATEAGLGSDGRPPMRSSQSVSTGFQRRSKSAARWAAWSRRLPWYQCRAQIEFGRARRTAPASPTSGTNRPNNPVRYFPFSAQTMASTPSTARIPDAVTRNVTSMLFAPITPQGLNPASSSPRQAAVRLTASTDSWPSPLQ